MLLKSVLRHHQILHNNKYFVVGKGGDDDDQHKKNRPTTRRSPLTLFHMGYFFDIFRPPLFFSETTKDITMKLSSIVLWKISFPNITMVIN